MGLGLSAAAAPYLGTGESVAKLTTRRSTRPIHSERCAPATHARAGFGRPQRLVPSPARLTKRPTACQHPHMPKGAYQLRDIAAPVVRVYCPDCHRFAQFGRDRLIERFGPEQPMPSLLRILKPCSTGDRLSGSQCQLAYFDRLMPERQAEAVDRGGLPAAWRVDWHSRRD
jgi:hypothetical protein